LADRETPPNRETPPSDADSRASDADSRATIARLTVDTLPRLIERLTKSQLGELEVRENGWRIRLRRPLYGNATAPSPHPEPGQRPRAAQTGGQSSSDRPVGPGRVSQTPRTESTRGLVTSPQVGYFAPRDGLATGQDLRSGDVIGYVDVLGVRHEVVSATDGTLRGIDVEAGQAVEYGQPLARVEPGGRG
jgi:acetyl-CoA carboxylase biotin carboxyl carrier protein